jgi:hypothetical protein
MAVRDDMGMWTMGEAETNMISGPGVEVWGRVAS